MIELLEKAFQAVAKLPVEEQEIFARWILEELEDEKSWDEAFAKSQDVLSKMAAKALENYRAGLTEELDPDTL